VKALELFAGLGGFAAAAGRTVQVQGALDASAHVLSIYARNFSHPTLQCNLEGMSPEALRRFDGDLWWMSPPCQPYTVRGHQRDLDDPRALSFIRILEALPLVLPPCVALENVSGFQESRARAALLKTLDDAGYVHVERILCPTELGIPNRRPRYYLAAARESTLRNFKLEQVGRSLPEYLDASPHESLFVTRSVIEKYGAAFHPIEVDDDQGIATCFTSAYGKSWTHSGSYLRYGDGRVRLFSPQEIIRLHHFAEDFNFPPEVSLRRQWKYAGNSLNVAAVREVLHVLGLPVLQD
jgi:DNA (cytosine-5)-methyltransferase 1